jgi:mutual gliding-motility protein MglA
VTLINRVSGEISCKLVYCGAAGAGKTRNLRYVLEELPAERRGEGVSMDSSAEKPLYFEYLPLELGSIAGFRTRLHLYSAPSAEYFAATRKHVLDGADGIVFVVDSRAAAQEENVAALRQLHRDLAEKGTDPAAVPLVLQYNKRDLGDSELVALDELDEALNFRGVPAFPASAVTGNGVFPTLRGAAELVLRNAVRTA